MPNPYKDPENCGSSDSEEPYGYESDGFANMYGDNSEGGSSRSNEENSSSVNDDDIYNGEGSEAERESYAEEESAGEQGIEDGGRSDSEQESDDGYRPGLDYIMNITHKVVWLSDSLAVGLPRGLLGNQTRLDQQTKGEEAENQKIDEELGETRNGRKIDEVDDGSEDEKGSDNEREKERVQMSSPRANWKTSIEENPLVGGSDEDTESDDNGQNYSAGKKETSVEEMEVEQAKSRNYRDETSDEEEARINPYDIDDHESDEDSSKSSDPVHESIYKDFLNLLHEVKDVKDCKGKAWIPGRHKPSTRQTDEVQT